MQSESPFIELEDETPPQVTVGGYPLPEQHGPLRWHDTAKRCMSRRCGTTTFCSVRGMWLCMKHALDELNKLLIDKEKQ
jgi:hypothetical protein